MNRNDFLERLFLMYPASINETNMEFWVNAYESVLPPDIDYDKLFNAMIANYDYTHAMPSPKWLKDHIPNCRHNEKCEALKHYESLKNEISAPIPESFKLKIANLKKNIAQKEVYMQDR